MKLIDADKLKDDFKCLKFIIKEDEWNNDDEMAVLATINAQPKALLSCPKCHGNGTYKALDDIDEHGQWTYKKNNCEVCHGTGKMTIEFYEELQKGCRK